MIKNKLRVILEEMITVDDNNRHKIYYDLCKTLDKAEKKIRNLKVKEL